MDLYRKHPILPRLAIGIDIFIKKWRKISRYLFVKIFMLLGKHQLRSQDFMVNCGNVN